MDQRISGEVFVAAVLTFVLNAFAILVFPQTSIVLQFVNLVVMFVNLVVMMVTTLIAAYVVSAAGLGVNDQAGRSPVPN
ncbi:hypothetical protein [Tropicibacter sp. Alg240-R139]|uniref:hypothetical protein n=1 Tax=Tropicibacter sp. Alg240-R139 TaxID=2305991 RepID=UPI0013E0A484|nr:hypothetical protein [Tropicibacter sp. Alg240-R139]